MPGLGALEFLHVEPAGANVEGRTHAAAPTPACERLVDQNGIILASGISDKIPLDSR
jgi:hypothetical protein